MKNNIITLCLLIAMFLTSCTTAPVKKKNSEEKPVKRILTPENNSIEVSAQEKVIPVKVMLIQPQEFQPFFTVSATAKAKQDVNVSSAIGGTVEDIFFHDGDWVDQGKVVMHISERAAKAQLEQAGSGYLLAKNSYERQRSLYEKQLISAQQFEAIESQFQGAESQYTLAQIRYDNASVQSPISGKINEINYDKGEMAGPGMPIFQVINFSSIEMTVGVPEQNVRLISPGKQTKVVFDAIPEQSFTGTVTRISAQADQSNNTFPATVVISNSKGAILPGMIGRITVPLQPYRNAVVIPQDSIIEEDTGKYVFVVQNNFAIKQLITVGNTAESKAYVINGLAINEKLIVQGQRNIINGDKVTIVE